YLQPGYIGLCYRRTGNEDWINLGHKTRCWFENEPLMDHTTLLLATLEYGDINSFIDTLQIPRHPGSPHESVHIHPVIRSRSQEASWEIQLKENLLNRFRGMPENQQHLERFIAALDKTAPEGSSVV